MTALENASSGIQLKHPLAVRHRYVWSSRELAAIKSPEVDLCIWRRGVTEGLAGWLSSIAARFPLSFDEIVPTQSPVLPWLHPLPACPERESFADEVAGLMRLFGGLMRAEQLRVQLGTVKTRSCPKFHVDHVGVRMICTFSGSGTEWISEADVLRRRVALSSPRLAPMRVGAKTQHLERFDVALLKGSAFAGNERFGVVHRSPEVCASPRWVLVVDAR